MRLVNAQRQLRERGRIRIGYSTLNAKGDKIPHRSDTFIFSTPDEQTIREAAACFGGEPERWDEGRDHWRVVSTVAEVAVVFVGHMGFSQEYVQYRRGFPVVRCDGATCWTPGTRSRLDEQPCVCDPDNRDCQLTTHLSVILSELPGLGTWRIVTKSWYGAMELLATIELIEGAVAAGGRVPARLFITQRRVDRLEGGKPKVKKFPVIALDLNLSVAALDRGIGGAGGAPTGAFPAAGTRQGAPPALEGWQPVDQEALPAGPMITVADQLAEVERTPPRRANAAPPIKATGTRPRSAADAAAANPNCSVCDLPYGTATLIRNPEPGGSRFIHASHAAQPDENEPQEGEPPVDQPPPEERPVRDGSGAAGNDDNPPVRADPAPVTATAHVRMMTAPQHRKVMAISAEVWPGEEGQTSAEVDDARRENLLALCALLGQPGLTSRTQITATTAPMLLDALEEMKTGTLVLTDAGLVDTTTGAITVEAPS